MADLFGPPASERGSVKGGTDEDSHG